MTFDDFCDVMDKLCALGWGAPEVEVAPLRERVFQIGDALGRTHGDLCRAYEKRRHLDQLRRDHEEGLF